MKDEHSLYISAPGKVILHGEHAVVYGKSAIAASLNLRCHVRVKLGDTGDGKVRINLHNIGLRQMWTVEDIKCFLQQEATMKAWSSTDTAAECIRSFVSSSVSESVVANLAVVSFVYVYMSVAKETGVFPCVDYTLVSELPIGAGLGSSASLNVCLSAAILLQQGLLSVPSDGPRVTLQDPCPRFTKADLDLINSWAFLGETVIHGRPSGIDNSVATFGGALKFQEGKITKLKKMPALRILLTSTNVPRSTKTLVAIVKETYLKFPEILKPVMESVEAISERCQHVYTEMSDTPGVADHYHTLEELISFNQHLLQVMGVSHVTLDKICHVTAKYSLQSKLTGAGGGGCAMTLLRPDTGSETIDSIRGELRGFDCWETSIGEEGVVLCNRHNVDKYIKDFEWTKS